MTTTDAAKGTMADAPSGRRYTEPAIHLHWLTPPLILAQVVLAWVFLALPDNAPNQGFIIGLHKSLGLTIWLLILARLAWRFTHPAPAAGPNASGFLEGLGKVNHWLMYLVLFAMPISGFVMSATGPYGVNFWGLPLPRLPQNEALHDAAQLGHWVAQWALYALVLTHIAATVYHVVVRRDGTLERMLPAQIHAEPDPR